MENRALAMCALVLLACGGGSGDDDGIDPTGDGGDPTGDGGTSADAATPLLPVCVPSCDTPADCATGPAGSIIDADNYACESNTCVWIGCRSTAECVATYGTQSWSCEQAFGSPTPTCWPTCTSPAQCANAASPLLGADNYACEGNKCRWLGCNDTAECTAANNSPAWTCVTLPGATMRSCIHTCTTPADCATASAPYDADNYACTDNLCIWQGCNTTAECATVDPDWVCDE